MEIPNYKYLKFIIILGAITLGGWFLASPQQAQAANCSSATPDDDVTYATTGFRDTRANGVNGAVGVYFPTWSDPGGQDDIVWYTGTNLGGGTWKTDINLASHPGLGTINIHVYLIKAGGGLDWCDTANFTRATPPAPTANILISGSHTPSPVVPGTVVTVSWSSTNANFCQVRRGDDASAGPIAWEGTSGAVNTPITSYTVFRLYCQGLGSPDAFDQASINVARPTCSSATPDSDTVNSNSFRRTYANGVSSDVTSVLFPTWSDTGGQDDIIWYSGANQGGGTWYTDINVASHGTGSINVHVYLYSGNYSDGTFCDSANFSVAAAPTANILISGSDAPSPVVSGTVVTVSWSSGNANFCQVRRGNDSDAGPIAWEGTSGAVNTPITSYTVFRLYCQGLGSPDAFDQASINVAAVRPTCSSATPDSDTVYSNSTRRTYANGVSSDTTGVLVFAWNYANGQDDIVGYWATNSGGGTWYADVNVSNHGVGYIPVHVYLYSANYGDGTFCDSADFNSIAPQQQAYGFLDSNTNSTNNNGNCSNLSGWAYDPDYKNTAIPVHIYHNSTFYDSVTAGDTRADLPGNHKHAFTYNIPSGWKDGGSHKVDMYAIDLNNSQGNPLVYSPTTLNCPPPSVTLKANNTTDSISINYNTAATLSWTTVNATSCTLSPTASGINGGTSNTGVSTGNLTTQTIYTLSCTGPSGNNSATVTVNINSQPACTSATPDGDWTIANSGARRTYANGVTNATQVIFFAWSSDGGGNWGQNDIVAYTGTNQGGGTYYADIDLGAHPGLGTINVHVYLYNNNYADQWCNNADLTRLNSGSINVNSNLPTSWSITCPLTNPTCPTYSSGANQTSGTYNSAPTSTWTIVPANIPGYDATVTPNATQSGP